MITDINGKDRLVQQTFGDHLRDALGWDSSAKPLALYFAYCRIFTKPLPK